MYSRVLRAVPARTPYALLATCAHAHTLSCTHTRARTSDLLSRRPHALMDRSTHMPTHTHSYHTHTRTRTRTHPHACACARARARARARVFACVCVCVYLCHEFACGPRECVGANLLVSEFLSISPCARARGAVSVRVRVRARVCGSVHADVSGECLGVNVNVCVSSFAPIRMRASVRVCARA